MIILSDELKKEYSGLNKIKIIIRGVRLEIKVN